MDKIRVVKYFVSCFSGLEVMYAIQCESFRKNGTYYTVKLYSTKKTAMKKAQEQANRNNYEFIGYINEPIGDLDYE